MYRITIGCTDSEAFVYSSLKIYLFNFVRGVVSCLSKQPKNKVCWKMAAHPEKVLPRSGV
jgi:hypothetical protein